MTLPVNLPQLFAQRLQQMRRPPDGLLHASSDLVGSLRHSQLRAAGAPTRDSTLADEIVLMTGSLWHSWAHESLVAAGLPFMQEVKLDRWLPEGWSGTADWVFYDADREGFVLGDMKTIKGSAVPYIQKDGAKMEHLWQLSAYWHALCDMGLPMVQSFGVLYWPKDRGDRPDQVVEPVVQDCAPLPADELYAVMEARWRETRTYLDSIGGTLAAVSPLRKDRWLSDALAPEQDRVQKVVWNKTAWDLKLVPHWSARFCPFEPPLCDCSEQGETKIGSYALDGTYTPRKGYEKFTPEATPTDIEVRRRRKECS